MAISSEKEDKCGNFTTKSGVRHNLSIHCASNRQEIATSAHKGPPRNDIWVGQIGATILHFKLQFERSLTRYPSFDIL